LGDTIISKGLFHTVNFLSSTAEDCQNFCPCTDFFNIIEIRVCIQALKKGVGSIGVNNDQIRKFSAGKLDLLFQFIFNLCFHLSYWPTEWRSATIFSLIKGGNRNAWDPYDYRGISIVDTVLKCRQVFRETCL
jgi:hypothetical protein